MLTIDQSLLENVSQLLLAKKAKLVTAESCTGGGLSYYLTSLAGSSDWFERGFVTYSNEAKINCLQVKSSTLEKYGAVSAETAKEMAEGALRHSKAQFALSITGIAGPSGGSEEKPIGTVWIGAAHQHTETFTQHYFFSGDRHAIRLKTITEALLLAAMLLQTHVP